jgi:Sulfotransferase domain
MRLIGAGLPRTATLSQKVALETLGLAPCYHMVNVLADLDEARLWERALAGEEPWDEVFEGFAATVDWPGSYFYKELIQAYPEAKVLLSVRDADAWERSMRETIWGLFYGDMLTRDLSSARCRVDRQWNSYIEMMEEMWRRSGLIEDGERTTPESMQAAMKRFNEEVEATVPADRLLVWSAADGWEPLCRFLGLPVPHTPFPHLNDSKVFAERIVDGAVLAIQAWRAEGAPAVRAQ